MRSGLVDRVIAGGAAEFRTMVTTLAEKLAWSGDYEVQLAAKKERLAGAERTLALSAYRHAELAAMARNFFDPSEPYAGLRRAFVYKDKPQRTHASRPASN